jgi:hypothetical protein
MEALRFCETLTELFHTIGITSQKTINFLVPVLKNSNLAYFYMILSFFLSFFLFQSSSFLPNHCTCRGLLLHVIIHNHIHSVGLPSASDRPVAETNTQHSQEINVSAPGGIRIRIPESERRQACAIDLFDFHITNTKYVSLSLRVGVRQRTAGAVIDRVTVAVIAINRQIVKQTSQQGGHRLCNAAG